MVEQKYANSRTDVRASVKMLDRYSHITPHMQQEAADAFGEMFFRAPIGTKSALVE